MPVADAAGRLFGNSGTKLILVMSLVAAVSTMNANLMLMPRILFGMARHGLLPPWVTSINRGGTPSGALLLSVAISFGLILSGTFESLIGIASLVFGVVYLSGFIALFVLRKKQPKLQRPFRMWGYPWTNIAICVGTVAFWVGCAIADVKHALLMLLFLALTWPAYLVTRRMRFPREKAAAAMPLEAER
jgi:APA family basic amino acid/polyamine antiporter